MNLQPHGADLGGTARLTPELRLGLFEQRDLLLPEQLRAAAVSQPRHHGRPAPLPLRYLTPHLHTLRLRLLCGRRHKAQVTAHWETRPQRDGSSSFGARYLLLTEIACGRWQRPRSRQGDVSRVGRAVSGYVGTLNFRL